MGLDPRDGGGDWAAEERERHRDPDHTGTVDVLVIVAGSKLTEPYQASHGSTTQHASVKIEARTPFDVGGVVDQVHRPVPEVASDLVEQLAGQLQRGAVRVAGDPQPGQDRQAHRPGEEWWVDDGAAHHPAVAPGGPVAAGASPSRSMTRPATSRAPTSSINGMFKPTR
jgi:hypothetical protein